MRFVEALLAFRKFLEKHKEDSLIIGLCRFLLELLKSPLGLGFVTFSLAMFWVVYLKQSLRPVSLAWALIPLTVGFAEGLWLFFRGLFLYRKFRLLADNPLSHIGAVSMGLVYVHGKAVGEARVTSPASKSPCLYYRVEVSGDFWGWHPSGDRTDSTSFFHIDEKGVNFHLEDTTGQVLVDLRGVEWDLPLNAEREVKGPEVSRRVFSHRRPKGTRPPSGASDEDLLSYAASVVPERELPVDFRGSIIDCHFREYCVLPGRSYDLIGTCVENPDPAAGNDLRVIQKGQSEPTFLISWRSAVGEEAYVRHRAVKFAWGGPALSLASAIAIFWILNRF